eukprot:gene2315-17947_t
MLTILSLVNQMNPEVFDVIMDQVLESIKSRFFNLRELYQDFSCIDPCRFEEFKKEGLPKGAVESICKRMGLDSIVLREQLLDFHESFPRLMKTAGEDYGVDDEKGFASTSSEDESLNALDSDDDLRQAVKLASGKNYGMKPGWGTNGGFEHGVIQEIHHSK